MKGIVVVFGIVVTTMQATVAQPGCADQRCYRQQQQQYCESDCRYDTQNACDEGPAADLPAGRFVAPPPIGETTGGTNSMGLRFGELRIPEITIPLPTIQMPHMVFFHREPEVRMDRTTAGFHRHADVLDFGQLPPRDERPPAADERDDDRDCNLCPPPCPTCPQPFCPSGCTDLSQNNSELESRLQRREQQVTELKLQLAQLQTTIGQIAAQQSQALAAQQSQPAAAPQTQTVAVQQAPASPQQPASYFQTVTASSGQAASSGTTPASLTQTTTERTDVARPLNAQLRSTPSRSTQARSSSSASQQPREKGLMKKLLGRFGNRG